MKIENKKMQKFLKDNGIIAKAKYIDNGSQKDTWRINGEQMWFGNKALIEKFTSLGFKNHDHKDLHEFCSNGSQMSLFVKISDSIKNKLQIINS